MTSQNLSQGLQSFTLPGSGYGYTGAAIDDLPSNENTIAFGLIDESGSTRAYARQMELGVQEFIRSLRHCTTKDKLIYRHCHFDTDFREVHGFKPLMSCLEKDYDGCWAGGGQTALYKSECEVFSALLDYAEKQAAKRYIVNGFGFEITDGMNYLPGDPTTQDDSKNWMARCMVSESLESLVTICIGINKDPGVRRALEEHAKYVGFTQFIPIEDANEKSLAKIMGFLSRSLQAQSQMINQGGPSASLTF